MPDYATVEVKCPCGRVVKKFNNNAKSTSTTHGTAYCPDCKKYVEYGVCGTSVHRHYKN